MDYDEIALAIVEAALPRIEIEEIIGAGPDRGDAEAIGKQLGRFYNGVLAAIKEATKEPPG